MKIIKRNFNMSIYNELDKSANKYSNKIAFTCNLSKIKYSSLLTKINEYASSFNNMGIKESDVVTLVLPNGIDTMVCIYALNKIGAISNIMHYLSSEEEIKRSINDTSSHYIITYENKLNSIKNISSEEYIYNIIYISNNDILSPAEKIRYLFKKQLNLPNKYMSFYRCRVIGKTNKKAIKYRSSGEDTAIIINNNSKKIYLSNNNLNSYANNYPSANNLFTSEDKIFTDNSIINSIPIYHRSLMLGKNIIIEPREDIKSIIEDILRYKPNIIEISPNTLEQLISSKKVNKEDLYYLKLIICGKSILRDNVYKKAILFLKNHGSYAKIITTYGMIETTSNITINDNLDDKFESVGLPIKNTKIKILNVNDLKECKSGEVGIICINGPTVCKNDNYPWIYSDDLGYLDKDGYLYFKSSLKRVIVSNGIEIYPEELENIVKKHEYVKDASFVGVPHPYKKEAVKLYIVLKDHLVLNSEIKRSIKEYCEKNISKYALPYVYAYRKELPKTNVGKIAYQKLVNSNDEEE